MPDLSTTYEQVSESHGTNGANGANGTVNGSVNGVGGYSSRGALSDSVLTNPQSPIHCLAAQFQCYLHLPDPTPLYVAMGMQAGNMMTGTPVWLMLIGPSGCGKTALLQSLMRLKRIEQVSDISGEAGLLSGTKKKEIAEDATGGLLRTLGDNGCLCFMDFTSVLSDSPERVIKLLGVLRELFDRTWSRSIGGEGGRKLAHHGRVCLIAGVTSAIDRAAEVTKEMGERCLYYRYPVTTGYEEGMSAVQDTDPDTSSSRRALLVEAMFARLGLSYANPVKRRELSTAEAHRIVTLAQFGARCRSHVPRDRYTKQVIDVADPEVATRMAKELAQLYVGMEAIGNTTEEIWTALGKVAMDSMSMARRRVLEKVIECQGHAKDEMVAREVRVSIGTAQRILEDLTFLGIVQKNGTGYAVSDWAEEKLAGITGR